MSFKLTVPKGPIAAMYSSPGPCYQLPTLVGQQGHDSRSTHQRAPSFQFGIRHGARTDNCSPGPKYNFNEFHVYRDGKDGTPHYSLYSRPKDSTIFKTPGPGSYSPENTTNVAFTAAPIHSFGQRHKHRTTDLTPAPNSYSLPGLLGKTIQGGKVQAPSYTVLGRKNIGSFHEDLAKTPGPCAYNISNPGKYRMKAPEYSMLSRNAPPGDTTVKPGPGAHSPEKFWPHKRAAPGYSFGIRHSPYTTPFIIEVAD